MLGIKFICVGKMKERYFIEAVSEYQKRLTPYCRLEMVELPEPPLRDDPSPAELDASLEKQAVAIERQITPGAYIAAMCIEGRQMSSRELAELFQACADNGKSRICFIIGGSFGLHERVKQLADIRLSLSKMTFPHHLARVMLAEQVYRGIMINEGTKYHK